MSGDVEAGWARHDAYAWVRDRLTEAGVSSPEADARALLEWACGACSQWQLPHSLTPEQSARLRRGTGQREARIPLQHVTGRMYFRSLTLCAGPGVFVVRPETEILAGFAIDEAAAALRARGRARVVDLCAGSGAIALSVATEAPTADVWAVEREAKACALASQNRELVGVPRLHLERADATDPATLARLDGTVDVVVTNPPYVPADEMPTQPEAAADPVDALYGGSADGTDIPERIARRALALLRPGGVLLMEHSPSQARLMREHATTMGMIDAVTLVDLTDRPRFLRAKAPRSTEHTGSMPQ
ncbi:SAM-dependent methyltransferase [Schaalia meyeri]|uniref:N5-glutamine methyltransferase family protein n=1 Tax=Schaalia meyeri TaxID=52773 RepID=UPI00068180C4|nr:HemK/PrmC family methyltransferase [Schaalia meyeri]AKU65066.1 SAM-dependent methyltransferase [Schaalia meyeri]OFQ21689.1 protein-(glutamine-N5) methyltransferase, release factor-specific [Actinomyces sp. HMSC062G12]